MFQLMLAEHHEIATTSEPWIALHPLFALREGMDTKYDPIVARLALKEFLKQSGIDEEFYKKQINIFLTSLYTQAINYQNRKLFLDKTPRYYLIIDDLIELFPKAKFIVIMRHPLGVLNSIIKTWVKNDLSRLYLFKDDLLLAPKILVDAKKRHPNAIYTVKYEDLVTNPTSILNSICDFIGIQYYDAMSTYSKNLPDWKLGDPIGIHKHSHPSTNSILSWKTELSSPQTRRLSQSYIEKLGQQLVEKMGYNFHETIATISTFDNDDTNNLITWNDIFRTYSYKERYHMIKEKNNMLSAQQNYMNNSLSWKITFPIRFMSKLLSQTKLL